MMDTVIGLFPCNQNVNHQVQSLRDAGFNENRMEVITQGSAIQKALGINRNQIVLYHAILGALVGIIIYGAFAFAAGWCECAYFNFNKTILYEILGLGILVGVIIGGIIGAITGMAKYENATHLYTRGISLGDKVFILKTEPDKLDQAKQVLRKMGCIGVRTVAELNQSNQEDA
jgi:hypothetical protein